MTASGDKFGSFIELVGRKQDFELLIHAEVAEAG